MKIKANLFFKSFILAFVIFSLISGVIITSLYIDVISIEPNSKETTVLLGITDKDSLLSLMVLNFKPQENRVTYVPIPDNTFTEDKDTIQESFNGDFSSIENDIEDLIGTQIDRYVLFSVDALSDLTDNVGDFYFHIKVKFHSYEGPNNMNGELTKLMFEYQGYDMSKTSISDIATDYFTSFMSQHGNNDSKDKLINSLSSKTFYDLINTDLSKEEMREYAILLSKYSSFTIKRLEIVGQIEKTSSEVFFRPNDFKVKENIFK